MPAWTFRALAHRATRPPINLNRWGPTQPFRVIIRYSFAIIKLHALPSFASTSHNFVTMATPAEIQELLVDTLSLLEWRLRRLEFVLNGTVETDQHSNKDHSQTSTAVITRVRKLEHSLQQLSLKSNVAADLLKLRTTVRCRIDSSALTRGFRITTTRAFLEQTTARREFRARYTSEGVHGSL